MQVPPCARLQFPPQMQFRERGSFLPLPTLSTYLPFPSSPSQPTPHHSVHPSLLLSTILWGESGGSYHPTFVHSHFLESIHQFLMNSLPLLIYMITSLLSKHVKGNHNCLLFLHYQLQKKMQDIYGDHPSSAVISRNVYWILVAKKPEIWRTFT